MAKQANPAVVGAFVVGAVVLTRTLRADDLLDDRDPLSMDVAPLAPAGANDEQHASADHPDHGEGG